jgi:hypothetical protein
MDEILSHHGVKGMKWGTRKKRRAEVKAGKQLNKASYSYFQARASAKYDRKQSQRWKKAGDRRVAKAKKLLSKVGSMRTDKLYPMTLDNGYAWWEKHGYYTR